MILQELRKNQKKLEETIIGILVNFPKEYANIFDTLSVNDFIYYTKEISIFNDGIKNGEDITQIIFKNNFKISRFTENLITPHKQIYENLKIIVNKIKLYEFLEKKISQIDDTYSAQDNILTDIQDKIVNSISFDDTEETINQVIADFLNKQKEYEEKFKNKTGIIGLSTGYEKIDAIIDGLRDGHLWVIGGYTNMGKTWASLNIAGNLIKEKHRVCFYSLEMTKLDVLTRLVGILSNQSGLSVLKAFSHDSEGVQNAFRLIQDSNFKIYSKKSDIDDLCFSMVQEKMKYGTKVFFIDFLQLITVKNAKSEYESMTTAILKLQRTAQNLNVPIVVLSQISNEGARYGGDVMNFKGSGGIAAAADFAIEIKNGEEDKEKLKQKLQNGDPVLMKWEIQKNRHGRKGYIEMEFNGFTGIFKENEEAKKF